jgi:hypothetical protein
MAKSERDRTPFRVIARRELCRLRCALGGRSALDRPVFLTGCGRSGTTILGTILSMHPSVTYLNEPRSLWSRAYPQTDIWTAESARRGGRLALDGDACTPVRSKRLRDLFFCEALARGRPRLVEKLPANNFRLGFVDTIFPDALYIHLLRNGLEVARSIARMAEQDKWYGAGGYKWEQLADFAREREEYRGLTELVKTDFDRGLLEWRMSVEAALDFFGSLACERYIEVTYEGLLASPVESVERIERFIEIGPDEEVHRFAASRLSRKTPAMSMEELSKLHLSLAGDLLRRLGYLPA